MRTHTRSSRPRLQLIYIRLLHVSSGWDRQNSSAQNARHTQPVHIRQLSENRRQAQHCTQLCGLASQLLHGLLSAVCEDSLKVQVQEVQKRLFEELAEQVWLSPSQDHYKRSGSQLHFTWNILTRLTSWITSYILTKKNS